MLQMNLVRAEIIERHEQLWIQLHPRFVGIDLSHPAPNALGIKLIIPGAVKRVGDGGGIRRA
jgi:hypothetical protein